MRRILKISTIPFALLICTLVAISGHSYFKSLSKEIRLSYQSFKTFKYHLPKIELIETNNEDQIRFLIAHNEELEETLAKITTNSLRDFKITRVASVPKPAQKKQSQEEELVSLIELNTSEPIRVAPVKVTQTKLISWSSYFDEINLGEKLASLGSEVIEVQNVMDHVKTASSSIERSSHPEISPSVRRVIDREMEQLGVVADIPSVKADIENLKAPRSDQAVAQVEEPDDMIVFDYSSENKDDLTDQVLKSALENSSTQKIAMNTQSDFKKILDTHLSRQNGGYSIVKKSSTGPVTKADDRPTAQPTLPEGFTESANDVAKEVKENQRLARLKLVPLEAHVNREIMISPLMGVEFVPEYNPYERPYSDKQGSIYIEEILNSNYSTLRGTLLLKGKMRTKVDIALEEAFSEGENYLEIPMIDQKTFEDFLNEKSLRANGGFVLVDLSDMATSVDVDARYEAKIYLDQKFKIISDDSEFRYVLFVGVEPGNTLIKYQVNSGEYAEKIVHVTEFEVYFERNEFVRPGAEAISLTERGLLGNRNSELVIDEKDIRFFNTDINLRKAATNLYEYSRPNIPQGMRKYVETKHLGESIFIGYWDEKPIEIPNRDFIEQVMGSHGVNTLDGRCIIQLNFSKEVRQVDYSGETLRGPMRIEHSYLDKDGLGQEPNVLTTNMFLIGDLQGIINLKISYEDDSSDFLQTYCSEETYLIEQL